MLPSLSLSSCLYAALLSIVSNVKDTFFWMDRRDLFTISDLLSVLGCTAAQEGPSCIFLFLCVDSPGFLSVEKFSDLILDTWCDNVTCVFDFIIPR